MRLTGRVPPTRQAVEAVLSILKESPSGASTKEIYRRAMPTTLPRNALESASESPFQSVRYLKKTVLETLKERGIIEKFHVPKVQAVNEPDTAPKTKKKQSSNVPKFAWLWRMHEWERAVGEAKEESVARMKKSAQKKQGVGQGDENVVMTKS